MVGEVSAPNLLRPNVMRSIPTQPRRGPAAATVALPARQARIGQVGSALRRPRVTLAGAAFVTYLWVIHSGKLPIGAAAIVLGLAGLVLQHRRLRLPAPLIWLGGFLLWASLGYFVAEHPELTSERIYDYVKIWLIFLLALNLADSRGQLRRMMIAWLAIFALYPVRGIFFNFLYGYSTGGRYAWIQVFGNPNDFATLTLPPLAMSVALLQSEKARWVRYAALAGVIVLPLAIVITQSRGGILALFTFGALVLIQYRRRAGAIFLVLLSLGAISQLAPPEVWGRISAMKNLTSEATIAQADTVGSAQARYDVWRVARGIIADHKVFGVGVGGYSEVHAEYAATGRFPGRVQGRKDSHSTYLHAAAETGFPGVFLFLGVVLSTLWLGFKGAAKRRATDPGTSRSIRTLLFGLIAFMQASIFASMEHLPYLYIYIAMIYTLIVVSGPGERGIPVPAVSGPDRRR